MTILTKENPDLDNWDLVIRPQRSLLYSVLPALEVAGIPAVLLKGAALYRTLYADIGLRPRLGIGGKGNTEILTSTFTLKQQFQ